MSEVRRAWCDLSRPGGIYWLTDAEALERLERKERWEPWGGKDKLIAKLQKEAAQA